MNLVMFMLKMVMVMVKFGSPDIRVEYLFDFTSREEKQIMEIVEKEKEFLIKKWYEYSKNKQWPLDPIDRMIFEEGLRIHSVYFNKELDLMLIVLNTKKI